MYKATENGIIKEGRALPPLTEEDRRTILSLFVDSAKHRNIHKEDGIWKNICKEEV